VGGCRLSQPTRALCCGTVLPRTPKSQNSRDPEAAAGCEKVCGPWHMAWPALDLLGFPMAPQKCQDYKGFEACFLINRAQTCTNLSDLQGPKALAG
jgi:hypothetical protein